MAKYKIKNTNLMHNGDFKKVGSIIELTEEEAKLLSEFITPVKETKTPTITTKTLTKTKTKDTTENTTTETTTETPTTETTGGTNGK